jgi:hypothetical protein
MECRLVALTVSYESYYAAMERDMFAATKQIYIITDT